MTGKFRPPRPDYPTIYKPGESVTALNKAADEQEAESQRHLNEVIEAATTSGKQPFDYEVFRKAYWNKDIQSDGLTGEEPPEVMVDYLKRYYLDYPEAQSVEDFARQLEVNDLQADS